MKIVKASKILIFNPNTLYIKAGKKTSPGGNINQKSL
jgi:hypothetical protein